MKKAARLRALSNQIVRLKSRVEQLERTSYRFSWVRIAVFCVGPLAIGLAIFATEGWLAALCAVVWLLLFGVSVYAHRRVKRGIERTAMILMPVLFALVCGLAIYAATLAGAGAGYHYYLSTDWGEILSREVLTQAAGQAFFSLSLGMGAMLTFGSYLGRDHNLPDEAALIAVSDLAVAFVAGLVVFPMIFALGLSDEVGASTVGALFITLPQAFAGMGPIVGRIVGFVFFAALVVGALTSAISLLEVVVSAAIDGLGWSRRRAAVAAGAAITLLGVPAAWSLGVLDVMDQVANNLLLLGGGLALSLFVGWVMEDPIAEVRPGAEGTRWFFLWRLLLRFAVPAILLYVLWDAVPGTFSAISDLFGS